VCCDHRQNPPTAYRDAFSQKRVSTRKRSDDRAVRLITESNCPVTTGRLLQFLRLYEESLATNLEPASVDDLIVNPPQR
jgi:hypothetical protein